MTSDILNVPLRKYPFAVALSVLLGASALLYTSDPKMLWMFTIALAMGISLFHASFGFSAAYRNLFLGRDTSGVQGHLILLAATTILFAPFLAQGSAFGSPVGGAVAPVGVGMATGAFLFGVGMQLAGACASGTLFTAGSGNPRMLIVLVFFSAGTFWGSLDLAWWSSLPQMGAVSLGNEWGWGIAVPAQLLVIGGLYLWLRKNNAQKSLIVDKTPALPLVHRLLRGPWPFLWAALSLAFLNWLTLISVGYPWSITWGFTLWAGKVMQAIGWDPASSSFWSSGFQMRALSRYVWEDTTSVMNLGIMAGASIASIVSVKAVAKWDRRLRPLLSAIIGGLLLGYGARLAYGCNIGAFVSGVASTSVHGWVWILCALPGNWIGMKLRPVFRLSN